MPHSHNPAPLRRPTEAALASLPDGAQCLVRNKSTFMNATYSKAEGAFFQAVTEQRLMSVKEFRHLDA